MSVVHEREVGGLRCSQVLARLGEYVDGELSAEVAAAMQAHVRGCGVCERFGGRFAAMVAALRAAQPGPAVDAPSLQRLREALAAGPR